MVCKNCGSQLVDGDLFCKNCGSQVIAELKQMDNQKIDQPDSFINKDIINNQENIFTQSNNDLTNNNEKNISSENNQNSSEKITPNFDLNNTVFPIDINPEPLISQELKIDNQEVTKENSDLTLPDTLNPTTDSLNPSLESTPIVEALPIENEKTPPVTEVIQPINNNVVANDTISLNQQNSLDTKKTKIKDIILFLIIIILLGVIAFLIFNKAEVKEPVVNQKNIVTKIYSGYYSYNITDKYDYTVYGDILRISKSDDLYKAEIVPVPINFSKIDLTNLNNFLTDFATIGSYEGKKIALQKYDNHNYLTIEFVQQNKNILIALTAGKNDDSLLVAIKNKNNTINYNALNDLSLVINNAKYNSASFNGKFETMVNDYKYIINELNNKNIE